MLHPNVEARVAAHQIFSILLLPNSNRPRHDVASMRSGILYQSRKWNSSTSSAFASITARLEKLLREKDGSKAEKQWQSVKDDIEEKEIMEEECKQGHGCKNSLNCYNISSIIHLMAGSVVFTEVKHFSKFCLTGDNIHGLCILPILPHMFTVHGLGRKRLS